MSQVLPLFPLQIVVFPGEQLNLHIFEPRYQQLIQECKDAKITFGIPAYINGKMREIGTQVRLEKISKQYVSGEMDVKTQGIGLFAVKELFNPLAEKLYAGADVEFIDYQKEESFLTNEKILGYIRELFDMLQIEKDLPTDTTLFNTYDWGHHVGFSLQQEYDLLCLVDANERQQFMLNHLNQLLPAVKNMERIREKAQMNGHFRNIIPPDI
ncbi:MAG: ATP-dependent protease [Saprospiraceae bacterium]|nr:MAG: ATP-dependent protease [Saprospiraceae bacterium]